MSFSRLPTTRWEVSQISFQAGLSIEGTPGWVRVIERALIVAGASLGGLLGAFISRLF